MRNSIWVMTGLALLGMLPAMARAELCGAEVVASAQTVFNRETGLYGAGVVSKFELLMSEKSLLELKFCQSDSDYGSFKALAVNANARLALADALYAAGTLSATPAALVGNERKGLAQTCSATLLPRAAAHYNAGIGSQADVKTVTEACALLQ